MVIIIKCQPHQKKEGYKNVRTVIAHLSQHDYFMGFNQMSDIC